MVVAAVAMMSVVQVVAIMVGDAEISTVVVVIVAVMVGIRRDGSY